MFATARACLKKAFRELRIPVCGRFYPNEGGVAGYGNRMRVKYTAKWGLQIAEMIFQTRSRKPAIPPRCANLSRRDRGLPGHWTLLAQTISCRGVLCKLIMHKRLNEHFIVASACLSLFG